MPRTVKRKIPKTVEELEQCEGNMHCWRSSTGIIFTLHSVGTRNMRSHLQFKLILIDWDVTKCDWCSGSEWTIPQLQDAGASYVGNILGVEA
jgi:hypothetical protein